MKKTYLALAACASLSVFSAVSTSTAFYTEVVEVISPQACESVFQEFSDSLFFGSAGVVNRSEFNTSLLVTCPIPRSALAEGRNVIFVGLRYDAFGAAPTARCTLDEINNSTIFIQSQARTVQLQPATSVRAVFEDVRPLVGDSAFVLTCGLEPDVTVQNIEIRAVRPN